MQYVRLYENKTTGNIDHVITKDVPFSEIADEIRANGADFIIHEIEIDEHQDGFQRARYFLDRMQINGNAVGWKPSTPDGERMNIVATSRRPTAPT